MVAPGAAKVGVLAILNASARNWSRLDFGDHEVLFQRQVYLQHTVSAENIASAVSIRCTWWESRRRRD